MRLTPHVREAELLEAELTELEVQSINRIFDVGEEEWIPDDGDNQDWKQVYDLG